MPVENEQRIVDSDRETEHHSEHHCHRVELHDARERHCAEGRGAEPDAGADERKGGPDEGTEHDHEYDRRRDDAHDFSRAEDARYALSDVLRDVEFHAVDTALGLLLDRALQCG